MRLLFFCAYTWINTFGRWWYSRTHLKYNDDDDSVIMDKCLARKYKFIARHFGFPPPVLPTFVVLSAFSAYVHDSSLVRVCDTGTTLITELRGSTPTA